VIEKGPTEPPFQVDGEDPDTQSQGSRSMDRHAQLRRIGSRVSTRCSFLRLPLVRLVLVGGVVLFQGCFSNAESSDPGNPLAERTSLLIRVTTEYADGAPPLGSDVMYTAFVYDKYVSHHRAEQPITPNGQVLFSDLGEGFTLDYGIQNVPTGCHARDQGESLVTTDKRIFGSRDTATYHVLCDAPSNGTLEITINGLPTGAAPVVTVSGASIATTNVGGTGQTFPDLTPGDYQIDALPVEHNGDTYLPSPAHQTATVIGEQTVTATVQYSAAATLNVDVNGLPAGAAASVTISGPGGFSRTLQGSDTLEALAPGTYTVTANTVSIGGTNWQPTPLSQTVELVSGATGTATVDYAEALGVGTLDVVVTGMPPGWDADVTVTDPSGGTLHLAADSTLTDLAPGVYTVSAAALEADYHMEPEVDTLQVEVKVGETASVEVSYLTVSDNLLVDPSWEIGLVTVATPVIPTATGEWHGDLAGVTGEENGIKPADGLWMLHCIATGPFGAGAGSTGCEMYQLLAVPSELAGAIAGGSASVAAQALFNRVAGDAETDSRFTVDIFAFDGAPADASAKVGTQVWLARQLVDLDTDADTLTWQPLQSVVAVPTGTTVLLLRLVAGENVKDDAALPEFDGHYMDDASLVIRWKRTF